MVNDISTLIRYSLPGWVFILLLLLPHLSGAAFDASCQSSITSLTVAQPGSVLSALGATVIVAAIPIGFVIYQAYFLSHWIWNRKARRKIPQRTCQGTALEGALSGHFSRDWFLVESYWYVLLAQANKERGGTVLAARGARLFDIYHALGVVSTAAILSTVCTLATLTTAPGRCLLLQTAVWLPTSLVLIMLWITIWGNRTYVRENIEVFQNHTLRYLEEGEQARDLVLNLFKGQQNGS